MRDSLLLLALLYSSMASAEEAVRVEALPEGFFEFLGLIVEQDGELIDPLSLGNPVQIPDPPAALANEVSPDLVEADADPTDAKKTEEHR